jgi:hypothetical protein
MNSFRIYLIILIFSLGSYTYLVGSRHGWDLLAIFFNDL